MAIKQIRIGSQEDIHQYDDGDYDSAIETDQPIKSGTPIDPNDVVRLIDITPSLTNLVSNVGSSTNNAAARFDLATGKIIQDSLLIIDDSGNLSGIGNITLSGTVDGVDVSALAPLLDDSMVDTLHRHSELSASDGTPNPAMSLDATGLINFSAGAGLANGCCHGDHVGWSQAAAAQNTWYNISDSDIISGTLRSVSHDGNGKLTVTEPGLWLILYTITFETNAANKHIDCGIEINGSGSADVVGISHLEVKFSNEEEALGGYGPIILADNATIEVCIRTTDAGTPTISVQDIELSAILIGGGT